MKRRQSVRQAAIRARKKRALSIEEGESRSESSASSTVSDKVAPYVPSIGSQQAMDCEDDEDAATSAPPSRNKGANRPVTPDKKPTKTTATTSSPLRELANTNADHPTILETIAKSALSATAKKKTREQYLTDKDMNAAEKNALPVPRRRCVFLVLYLSCVVCWTQQESCLFVCVFVVWWCTETAGS